MTAIKHATLDQLLAFKDGERSRGVADHLAVCSVCAAELDRLHQVGARLRALPVRRPPRDRWPVIRAAVERERRLGRWRRTGWGSLALAASLALALGGRVLFHSETRDEADDYGAEVAALVEYSQQLEGALQAMEPESRVLNGRAAVAVADIQDRIAWVDAQLAQSPARREASSQVANLWRERVELMDALVNVHATRVANVGF